LLVDEGRDSLYVSNGGLEQLQVVSPASTALGSVTVLSDVASLLAGYLQPLMHEQAQDRVYMANNRHATLAVVDAAAAPDDMQIDSVALPGGVPGRAYSATLGVSGGVGPRVFSVTSGALPPGLNLNPDGSIDGTPTEQGTFSFMVTAADASTPAVSDVEDLQIEVLDLQVVTRGLPDGQLGVPYQVTLVAAGGWPCAAPADAYTWSLDAGSLPAGLNLNPDGTITGTPTTITSDPVCFTVMVEDCEGRTAVRELCITVSAAPPPRVDPIYLTKGAGPDDVVLEWSYPGAPALAGFNVYRSDDGGGAWVKLGAATPLPPTTTVETHTDPVLTDGVHYWYRVRAVNDAGTESPD
jgi:hypothetical protein